MAFRVEIAPRAFADLDQIADYSIDEATQTVQVFHIRHWARRALNAGELRELMDESL